MEILLKCISEAAEHLGIWNFWPHAHMVCMFFITFLHNSCNFQYLILGWSTLVLSPSIIVCEPSQAVVFKYSSVKRAFLNAEVMSDLCKVSLFDFSGLIYIYVAYFNQLLHGAARLGLTLNKSTSQKPLFTWGWTYCFGIIVVSLSSVLWQFRAELWINYMRCRCGMRNKRQRNTTHAFGEGNRLLYCRW